MNGQPQYRADAPGNGIKNRKQPCRMGQAAAQHTWAPWCDTTQPRQEVTMRALVIGAGISGLPSYVSPLQGCSQQAAAAAQLTSGDRR
jgi:hypothetical protein